MSVTQRVVVTAEITTLKSDRKGTNAPGGSIFLGTNEMGRIG
jgi:hypothetical protein